MEQIEKFFPLNAIIKDTGSFVVALLIYIFAPGILGTITAIISWIPFISWIVGVITSIFGLYCLIGLVLSIVKFANLKK